MSEQEKKAYFDNESLKRLIAAEGKTVKFVVCYLWQNSINKNDVVELIDNLELRFTDKTRLTLTGNEENDGLDAVEFDYEKEKQEVEKEFEGKIRIFGVDASSTKMWQDVIGKQLVSVQLTKENSNYLSDSVLLDFGTEKRTVSVSPLDGLIIDFWEED
ncbi:MAG: hypothetical protein ACXVPQ_12295 [Bacteroidia bacterium]